MARALRRNEPDEQRERARLQVDERRAQLVALGLRLFSERSYDELSIDDIAQAAGISKGLLYHYFSSKRDFYAATVRSAAESLLERTDPGEGADPEALRVALDQYLCFAEEHASAYVALMRSGVGHDAEVAAIVEDTRARFVARLAGRIGLVDLPPRVRLALRGWLGFVEGSSLDWLARRDLPRDELRDLLAHMLIATLMAVDAAPQG